MRMTIAILCLLVTALTVPSRAQNVDWHLTAQVAESCSCTKQLPFDGQDISSGEKTGAKVGLISMWSDAVRMEVFFSVIFTPPYSVN